MQNLVKISCIVKNKNLYVKSKKARKDLNNLN